PLSTKAHPPRPYPRRLLAELTPKEREILALLIKRHTNQEIAEELHLSANTVKTHVKNILKELHFSSRSELFKVG
ncbi:MAG: helix-turn-helix transcriptional regulator, partial [Rubrobacter sp.]